MMTERNRTQYTNNKKAKILSGIITFIISGGVLFFILTYQITLTTITPPAYIHVDFEKDDADINFGINTTNLREEISSDSTILSEENKVFLPEEIEKPITTEQQENKLNDNSSTTIKKTENKQNSTKATTKSNTSNAKLSISSSTQKNTKNTTTSLSNQEKNAGSSTKGNNTVEKSVKKELEKTGNTKESIGNGRNLISFIPGTEGKKGKIPSHKCTGSGTIVFTYTVDKNGNIISAIRKSGINNTCLVNTGIKWIKQYVKANRGTRSVTGTYRIKF